MAVINTLVPGGEFVIASNSQGQISPAMAPLCCPHSDSVHHVNTGRMGPQSPSTGRPLRLAPQDWNRLEPAGSQDRNSLRVRNLHQPGGIQHHSERRIKSAVLLCQVGDQSGGCDSATPIRKTFWSLLRQAHSARITSTTITRSSTTTSGILSVQRSLSSSTSFEAQYVGSYTVHADNLTTPESLSGWSGQP